MTSLSRNSPQCFADIARRIADIAAKPKADFYEAGLAHSAAAGLRSIASNHFEGRDMFGDVVDAKDRRAAPRQ